MEAIPYLASLVCSATILLGLAVYTWRYRRETSGESFSVMSLFAAAWALCCAIQGADASLKHQVFWRMASELCSTLLALSWTVMVISRTGNAALLKPAYWCALFAIPCITLGLNVTSQHQQLYLSHFHFAPDGFSLYCERGWWWYIDEAYAYLLLLASLVLLARSLLRPSTAKNRLQLLAITLTGVVPLLADFMFQLGGSPVRGVNLAPCTLAFSGLLCAWAIFKCDAFELIPLVQGMLIERMPDPVLAFNGQDQLVHFNGAAQRLFGLAPSRSKGQPPSVVFAEWECLRHLMRKGETFGEEVVVEADGCKSYYELCILAVVNKRGAVVGRMVDLHEITKMKNATAEREKLLAELQKALASITTPAGLLPVCSFCNHVRDDDGSWSTLSDYIQHHPKGRVSHGICPQCATRYFGDAPER